jgi:hypothetical protein
MPACIKTGCDLHDDALGRTVHGDLFEMEEVYIFNAVLKDGQSCWLSEPSNANRETLHILDGQTYFERRGVIVVRKFSAIPNSCLRQFLAKWHPRSYPDDNPPTVPAHL